MDSSEIGSALRSFTTPDIADALDALGYPDRTAFGVTRMWDDCPRIAGRVMPIKLAPDADGSTVTGTLEAIEAAAPGDVLLFDNGGRLEQNTFGGIAGFCADRAGIEGAIADGASRDIDDLRSRNFPLYARGSVTTSVKDRTGMVGYDVPVECAGVAVEPDDYVVADGSGVIFVPGDEVETVLEITPTFVEHEREIKRRIAEGEDPIEVHEDVDYEDFEARVGLDE
jgi:regulator of RNase E activity RraA